MTREGTLATPTTASMRKLIESMLISDSELDAFCLDHFPQVKKLFTLGMDRITKINILLERGVQTDILECLRQDQGDMFQKHEHLLIYQPKSSIKKTIASRPKMLLVGGAAMILMILIGGITKWLFASPSAPPEMVYLSGGAFQMGSTQEEIDTAIRSCQEQIKQCVSGVIACEGQLHTVRISSFFLDVHEVTNRDFAAWVNRDRRLRVVDSMLFGPGDQPVAEIHAEHGGLVALPDRIEVKRGYEQKPAVGVTWHGARMYCEAQSKRLPAEAEWEYAARGIERRLYPHGNRQPECNGVRFGAGPQGDEKGGPCDQMERGPAPVGLHRPEAETGYRLSQGVRTVLAGHPLATWDVTPTGIWDLTGNVAEWVDDRYKPQCPETIAVIDVDFHDYRVVRGGDWYSSAVFTRAASRRPFRETEAADHIGFRCAKPVQE